MYERFYGFRERPFSLTPDPSYLYLSRVHKEALSHLRYGIEGHAGFIVITGEIGCGKTTMLQTVLRALDQKTSIARLMNTMLDARELLEAIMLDFGLEPRPEASKPYLLRDLARFLVDQRNAGKLSLVVIDEAQNLSIQALEEIRMLSNLETEKSKLIHIVLIGQPNLRDLLARPELEQLRQRVTVSYHLDPLTADDTYAYINHRLKHASVGAPMTFPRDVTDIVHEHSRGVARMINVIADAVLLYGYGADKHAVDVELAREVIDELGLGAGHAASNATFATPVLSDIPKPALSGVEAPPKRPEPPPPSDPPAALPPPPPPRQTTPAGPPKETEPVAVMRRSPTHVVFREPAAAAPVAGWWARFRRTAFGAFGNARPASGR